MIQIGHRIWIVGNTANETVVYFEGSPVPAIQELQMNWSISDGSGKYCYIRNVKDHEGFLEAFATEMALHGFVVEIGGDDSLQEIWFDKIACTVRREVKKHVREL